MYPFNADRKKILDNGGPAFPSMQLNIKIPKEAPEDVHRWAEIFQTNVNGMSLRAYLVAHAPPRPLWFIPKIKPSPNAIHDGGFLQNANELYAWEQECKREEDLQWPLFWADEQIRRLK